MPKISTQSTPQGVQISISEDTDSAEFSLSREQARELGWQLVDLVERSRTPSPGTPESEQPMMTVSPARIGVLVGDGRVTLVFSFNDWRPLHIQLDDERAAALAAGIGQALAVPGDIRSQTKPN